MVESATAEVTEHEIVISVPVNKSEVVASFVPTDFPVPNGREEDWRFAPLRRMRPLLNPLVEQAELGGGLEAPEGVTVEMADDDDPRLGMSLTPVDRVSALAWAGADGALVVTVPKSTELTEPIKLSVVGQGNHYERIRVIIENDAVASFVLDHTGTGMHASNVEVSVGDRSKLTFVSIQDWDRGAVQVARIHTQIGRDAELTQVVATFGGDLVRIYSTFGFDGPGGSVEAFGAYFADAGQHQEHRMFVDHSAPHCRSNVVYKGALQGEHAHTVWIGDVLIRAKAVGTQTYEMNRNLVLTDGARADSVPNLEIETGEVAGAGHASTTGRFDDEQLFYLQARGIPEDQARRLVVRGFFADVLDRIPDEAIRARLWQAVEDEVANVGIGATNE